MPSRSSREWTSLEELRGDFLRHASRDQFPPAFLASRLPNCNSPWGMLCRLALEDGSSRGLSTLSSETLQLHSVFINYPSSKAHKVWIYLLALFIAHVQSKPRAILKPTRQHWYPQGSSCFSQTQQSWSLRVTHTKLLFSSPSAQWRQWSWPSPGWAVHCRS